MGDAARRIFALTDRGDIFSGAALTMILVAATLTLLFGLEVTLFAALATKDSRSVSSGELDPEQSRNFGFWSIDPLARPSANDRNLRA